MCNSLKRSQFAGRPWRSKHYELLLSSSLNCHFKPHPLLISSLPFPFFFFYGKLNLPEQCGPVFHRAARSFACRGEKPPAGTSRRPFLITEGQRRHPINCQEALKKKKRAWNWFIADSSRSPRRGHVTIEYRNARMESDEEEVKRRRRRPEWRYNIYARKKYCFTIMRLMENVGVQPFSLRSSAVRAVFKYC